MPTKQPPEPANADQRGEPGQPTAAQPDGAASQPVASTSGPTSMAEKMDATYNQHTVYHWSNPFIVRATETVLAVTIVATLIIADLPIKSSVWIHFNFASPTIPIAAMFGVAALYHRNPLDSLFTIILLCYCLVSYLLSMSQILIQWSEIQRNRAQLPSIWMTIVELNFIQILTLIVDIAWYVCFLVGCPCFAMKSQPSGKKGEPNNEKDAKKGVGGSTLSWVTGATLEKE